MLRAQFRAKTHLTALAPGERPAPAPRAPSASLALLPLPASIFSGETLDKVCDVLSWVVLVVVPIVGIAVFWLVHILPEKIAEKREHPQAKAIQCLCLLSLAFGGLLWPIAWLWAYSKPVLYKLAYGTDRVAHGHDEGEPAPAKGEAEELLLLRGRVAELEARQAGKPGTEWRKG
jgi:hypothetical protein